MTLSHKNLAGWYLLLAQHLEAGLPIAGALQASQGMGLPASELETAARLIEQGGSVDDALHALRRRLPNADLLFLSAAAETGRLPRVLRNLSTRHTQYSSVKIRLILACLYPLAILHTGVLLFPAVHMINWEKGFIWDASAYARTVAEMLVPLWGAIITLLILARRQSPWLGRLAKLFPVFRGYAQTQALADFSFALGNFLDAGLSIGRAWLAAGIVARSPELQTVSQIVENKIDHGEAPSRDLALYDCFPEDFVALYRTGESTGQLEQNLLHLASLNQGRANERLKAATILYPALLFIGVAGVIAYEIISFYAGYYKMLGNLT